MDFAIDNGVSLWAQNSGLFSIAGSGHSALRVFYIFPVRDHYSKEYFGPSGFKCPLGMSQNPDSVQRLHPARSAWLCSEFCKNLHLMQVKVSVKPTNAGPRLAGHLLPFLGIE